MPVTPYGATESRRPDARLTDSGGIRTLRTVLVLAVLVILAPAIVAPAAVPTFGKSKALPQGNQFGEPSIASDAAGRLFVAAPGSHTAVWRSLDAGTTWARVADSLGPSGDSDVVLDADGTLYASDLLGNVPVSVSHDYGDSFAMVSSTAVGSGSNDRQWLAASGHGNAWSAWRDGSTERVAATHDGGVTWNLPVVAATGVGYQGNIVAWSDNDIMIPYTASHLMLAQSHDGGRTWTSTIAATSSGSDLFPAAARDDAGRLYVAQADGSNAYGAIRVSTSTDGGAAWDGPVTLSDASTIDIFPWMVAGAPGHAAVVWYQSEPQPLGYGFSDAAALVKWHVQVAVTADGGATWTQAPATGVTHTGPICTFGTLCFPARNPVALNRALLDFFEATALPDGRLAIAYAADAPTAVNPTDATELRVVVQNGGPLLR